MKRLVYLLIPVILLALSLAASASIYGNTASDIDLMDQRTFNSPVYNPSSSEGGLSGFWLSDFTIDWSISQYFDQNEGLTLWNYEYTLSSTAKDISHFILELTDGTTRENFYSISINGSPVSFEDDILEIGDFGEHPSNPGYPSSDDIYGIKFDTGGSSTTYSFTTERDPVFGNFYAKSGKHQGQDVFSYNNALAIENFSSNEKLDFIVRPDGGTPIVPEPVSSILFLTGSASLGFRSFLKRKKK